MALEWAHANISDFGGNPNRITVGGLSAGAQSAWLQLCHDAFLPVDKQIISQVYLWSNALAVQPNAVDGDKLTDQFHELCEAVGIDNLRSLSSREKVDELRKIDSRKLIDTISRLKMHTFRSSTDGSVEEGGFVSPSYLQSLHDGFLAARLAERGVRIMIGEVRDEDRLYKLINPPSSRAELKAQLGNYYPAPVVEALMNLSVYDVPKSDEGTNKQRWADIFGAIVGDCQVHASLRGLTKSLLSPPAGLQGIDQRNMFRYKICWRAKCLDSIVRPEIGVCHAADAPIWWANGWRAGFDDRDKHVAVEFLKPFGRFLQGHADIGWGGSGQADELRLLSEEGEIKEGTKDDDWTRALVVWDAMWEAQA